VWIEAYRNYQEKPERSFGPRFWQACGVSFYRQLADVQRTRRRFKPLRKRHVAKGSLLAWFGVMLATPTSATPSHFTLWIQEGADPHTAFVEDAEAK